MRNKILILIPIVLLALVLVGCIPGITPTPEPEEPVDVLSADVIVVEWEQVFDEEYANVIDIEYLITNTGTVDVDFSKILFEVTYGDVSDKDVYMVWINGVEVDVDCYESGYVTEVWVGSREVVDVVAIDWELASYE